MFGIAYSTWKDTCDMYFNLKERTKAAYLQWFPLTKISKTDEEYISSEEFYKRFIDSGAFVIFPSVMYRSENYIQKGDGSFRDASLISPILFLILQALGKEISSSYFSQRNDKIEVFYAGNYDEMRATYKQDYDDFFKAINTNITEESFFIKTDLTNFFANINVDILVNRIDYICNNISVNFTQTQIALFKELLLFCGNGRFPLIENSIVSSYLATVIYLDEIDCRLTSFIDENISVFDNYKIVRYVDDMYIIFSSSHTNAEIHNAYNQIRNEYSSILKEYGLALNAKKCCLKRGFEINDELKKSLYDEYFRGEKKEIESLFSGSLAQFLKELLSIITSDSLDVERYNDLIEKHFSNDTIEFTATEVFNYFVYEEENEVKSDSVKNAIIRLIKQDVSFISFDPKRISVLILKTKNDSAIKALLNQLFIRNRSGLWNSYDTIIAISYLIQSEFKHIDLIDVLRQNCDKLYDYYNYYCYASFARLMRSFQINKYVDIIGGDKKAFFLFFMYLIEKSKHNNLSKYAFYKNYFDRITADLAFVTDKEANHKKPNYKLFYKESELIKYYSDINGSKDVVSEAHKLRNNNPLSHSSAEMLDNDSSQSKIEESIKAMDDLLKVKIQLLKLH